jgi:RHS repeat-associated protein
MVAAVKKETRLSLEVLASSVGVVVLETHVFSSFVAAKKFHQANFSRLNALRVCLTSVKCSGTHQDRNLVWWEDMLEPTVYLYDGKNSLEEADSLGNVLARYTQPKYIDEPLAELRSSGSSFYEVDALGSITSLTNPGGAIANTYTYDSFGNATNFTGTLANPFRYAARESDSETGLYYYRARYYDPTSGRFISEDPIKFKGGINFYPYVKNDAVNWRDPDGKASAGSWANGWNWGTQGFSWLNCSIQASYCLSGLQGLVNSLQGMSNDAVLNSMAATNTAYNSNLNLKLGCSTGTCLAAFDQCLKAGQAIPLPTPPIPGP